jgi:hypothetical protein
MYTLEVLSRLGAMIELENAAAFERVLVLASRDPQYLSSLPELLDSMKGVLYESTFNRLHNSVTNMISIRLGYLGIENVIKIAKHFAIEKNHGIIDAVESYLVSSHKEWAPAYVVQLLAAFASAGVTSKKAFLFVEFLSSRRPEYFVEMQGGEMANMLRAFVKVNVPGPQIFTLVQRVCARRLAANNAIPRPISLTVLLSMLHSFSHTQVSAQELCACATREVKNALPDLAAATLRQLTKALTDLKWDCTPLLNSVGQVINRFDLPRLCAYYVEFPYPSPLHPSLREEIHYRLSREQSKEVDVLSLCRAVWILIAKPRSRSISSKRMVEQLSWHTARLLNRFSYPQLVMVLTSLVHQKSLSNAGMTQFANDMSPQLALLTPVQLTGVCFGFARTHRTSHPPLVFHRLAQVMVPVLPQLSTKQISEVVWSYAAARMENGNLFDAIQYRLFPLLSKFSPRQLATLAWSYAVVGKLSRPILRDIEACVMSNIVAYDHCDFSTIAWSFVVMDYLESKLVAHALTTRCSIHCSSCARQLHQCMLATLSVQQIEILPPSRIQPRKTSLTRLHRSIASTLKKMGVSFVMEHVTEQGISIDLALIREKIAIEVDGPSHFLVGTSRHTGRTIFKHRLLKKFGWLVVSIPFFDFREGNFKSSASRIQYLVSRGIPNPTPFVH